MQEFDLGGIQIPLGTAGGGGDIIEGRADVVIGFQ